MGSEFLEGFGGRSLGSQGFGVFWGLREGCLRGAEYGGLGS